MLVLTRRVGEAVYLGDDQKIEVRVLGISKGQVRLGFTAPTDMLILREEVPNKETKNIEENSYE